MADREAAGCIGNGKALEIWDLGSSLMLVEFQKDHLGVMQAELQQRGKKTRQGGGMDRWRREEREPLLST